jgi:hypothetical protein
MIRTPKYECLTEAMYHVGFNDYLDSTSAPLVLLGETALAATFILAVLVTIIVSSTVHRSAVSTNVYVSCE